MDERRAATHDEMLALGEALGRVLAPGDIIGLIGELGAGKTVLVKGIARGVGVPDETPVLSPTFTIINEYRGGRVRLYHVDLYRLAEEADLEQVGLDELYRDEAAVCVEWFDLFADLAPRDRLEVAIRIGEGDVRTLTVRPLGARAEALARAWGEGLAKEQR